MSTQVQYRRGTQAENDAFTGALAEITVDTTNSTLRVHDGVTPGGVATISANGTVTLNNKTLASPTFTGEITGDLIPSANITYDLGNSTNYWNNLYLAGNTIFLGSLQLKQVNATTFGVFTADGTTQADIDVGNIDVSAISQGNTVIGIAGQAGNAYIDVNGVSNVLVVSDQGVAISGTLETTGNITGSFILGNGSQLTGIDATSIQNGTANVRTFLDANVTISAAGTANIVEISGSGANIDGYLTTTGNITGDYLFGNGSQLQGIDATSIQNGTANVRTFLDANVTISAAGTANVVEISGAGANIDGYLTTTGNITGDYLFGNGSQLTGIDATSIQNGTANVRTFLNGNVTVSAAGTANVLTVTDTGANVSGTFDATGNITGGNISTTGVISASGNISGGNLSGTNVTGTLTTTSQPNITSVGTLTNLAMSGNIDAGNNFIVNLQDPVDGQDAATKAYVDQVSSSGFTIEDDTANSTVVSGGDTLQLLGTSNQVNVAVTNIDQVTFALTDDVSVTGNISSGNLATTGVLDVTGNVTAGNVSATIVSASNVDASGSVNTSSITGDGMTITASDVSFVLTGNVVMNNRYINSLATPQVSTDAATKQYVDDAVSSGIHIHDPVYLETPTALPSATYSQGGNLFTVTDTVAGNTVVFSTAANLQVNDQLWFTTSFDGVVANLAYFVVSTPNTSAAVLSTNYNGQPVSNITSNTGLTESVRVNSGQGAVLTATANGALTVDSVAVGSGNRILVYNQITQYENGVYVVSDTGNATAPWILTRASDADQYVPDTNDGIDQGSYFYVQAGATGAGESYVLTQPAGPFIIGLDSVEFTQFSASQVYTANTSAGINLTGTVFSAKVDDISTAFDGGGNIKVRDGAVLVTPNIGAATGTSLVTTGNISGDYILGNGSQLTGIDATSIQNGTANVRTFLNGNVTVSAAGTANVMTVTSTGANITGTVDATGNISGGNILAITGSVQGNNFIAGGNVTARFATVTTSSVSQVTLDSWSASVYRSGKYYCQVTSGTDYQVIELSMIHNASNVYLTQYGEILTNTSLGNFDASIGGGTVSVLFTPVNATTTVKASASLINV